MKPVESNRPSEQHFAAVPLHILVHIAWRNLASKKLRTFLTIFGVIIGIGAIFFLLSFGLGIQNLVTKEIIGSQSIKSIDITTPNSKIIKLDSASVTKIQHLPHVQKSGLSFSFPGSLKQKGGETDTVVYGVNADYQDMSNLTIAKGRLLKDADDTTIVINDSARNAMGMKDTASAIDRKIVLYIPLNGASPRQSSIEKEFTIIGVIESGSGSEVFIPNHLFETAGVPVYSQMKVITDDSKNVDALRKQIESQGFETSSPSDTITQINQIFRFFNIVLVGFGAIGMIVAVLGMFNTLTISLLERTREIGLMMALGGRNRDMSKLFIFEAVLLSVVGASVGILLATVFGQIVNIFMNNFAKGRGVTNSFMLFSTPLWLVGALILFMVMVGLLVAFFPAKRAHSIDPIDALRRE